MDSVRPKPKAPPVPAIQEESLIPGSFNVPLKEASPLALLAHNKTSVSLDTAPHKNLWKKTLWVLTGILAFGLMLFLFLVWKGVSTSAEIQVTGSTKEAPTLTKKIESLKTALLPGEAVTLKGEGRGRVNILLLGKAGEGSPGKDLTDTLMIASIETKEKKVALLSLPRDLYITLPQYGFSGKINSLYQFGFNNGLGIEPLSDAMTIITGEPIDYFFVIDFEGFEQTVDALGGITLEVPKDFYDPRYPGKNYAYETFELKKGWQKLDGPTALKYARERHDDPEGDFGRAKRQQQVLEAVKNKAFSPGTYLNFLRVVKLFESVENNVTTNITLEEMRAFYQLAKTLDTHNITNKVIDAWKPESLLRVSHQTLGGTRAFVLVPRTGNWQETSSLARNIFELDALAQRAQKIKEEQASLLILDSGETMQSSQKLAEYLKREFGFTTTILYAETLKQSQEPAILIARSGLTKPYSLDELLQRLPVKKSEKLPTLPANAPNTDFVLVMDETLGDIFIDGDSLFRPELEESFLEP